MSEITIEGKGIKRSQVSKLFDLLKEKFPDVDITRDGKIIKIPRSDKISKTKLKVYLKKFIHHEGERDIVKVLSGGHDVFIIHRKGGIEPVEEETEEEGSSV